jgi:hypothetical protein
MSISYIIGQMKAWTYQVENVIANSISQLVAKLGGALSRPSALSGHRKQRMKGRFLGYMQPVSMQTRSKPTYITLEETLLIANENAWLTRKHTETTT